jgi:hypothetical protein
MDRIESVICEAVEPWDGLSAAKLNPRGSSARAGAITISLGVQQASKAVHDENGLVQGDRMPRRHLSSLPAKQEVKK